MKSQHTAIWISGLTLFAVAAAGCVGDFEGTPAGKGSVVFCVQDDPTVNFNGVFVNFGNIQINQETSGNNTINDNDSAGDDTMATTTSDTMMPPGNDTNTTAPTTETTTTMETTTTAEAPETQSTGGGVTTITVDDIDCGRVEGEGSFDGVFRGQAGGAPADNSVPDNDMECAPENPGCVADERRGSSDSPCDRDQGFGNDAKCESVEVEAGDIDVLQFQDRKAAFLAQANFDPGTIQGVCLTVEDVRVVTNDGEEINVDIQNGDLCLQGPIEVREGQHTLVVFKIDVEQSFAQSTGDTIVFQPVIVVQAAAPVTTTITVQETVTETSAATNETSDTMSTTDTNMTTNATTPTETTMTTNETSSPAPTTTGP